MRILLFTVILFSLAGGLAGAQIYKWVDANGTVHFSDKPVADQQAEVVEAPPVQTYQEQSAPAASSSSFTPGSSQSRVQQYLAEQEQNRKYQEMIRKNEAKAKADQERILKQRGYSSYQNRLKDVHRRRWERQQLNKRAAGF